MSGRGTLDEAALASGLGAWLARQRGVDDVTVDELEQPSTGYSALTLLFRARWSGTEPVTEHLVLRMAPPSEGLFPAFDVALQCAAQEAAAKVGVPIAAPLRLETATSWLGAPFLVMPRIDGHIIGEAPAFDPWLTALRATDRAAVFDRFLAALAGIHRAPVEMAAAGGVQVRDDLAELDYWEDYLRWSSGGSPLPALTDALEWCRVHAPGGSPQPPVLLWGDVRLGNTVFGDDLGLRAVLDWDMTSIGTRTHDVAWLTVLTSVIVTLTGRTAEGLPDRDATVARYQELSGHDLHDLDWYETFALLRSTAIMTRIALLSRAAGQQPSMPVEDNPILDLLRARTSA